MRNPPTIAAVFVGILFVALLATGGAAASDASDHGLESCAVESPENYTAPEDDAIGYVDGYWYDQPIRIANDSDGEGGGEDGSTDDGNTSADGGNVSADGGNTTADGGNDSASDGDANDTDWDEGRPLDVTDGFDEQEIDAIVARTAARVETQRCLSFQSVPEVRVVNRSDVESQQRDLLSNRSTATRQFDDARLAVAMLLGHETDSTEARVATRSASSMGYYDPATDRIVLVASDGRTTIDEPTLAHELVHALQDQHFDLERFDADRTDADLAETGLIEGDASLVGYRYERRCATGNWSTCLQAQTGNEGNSEYLALELSFFQPYNDGARYVEHLYEEGQGWDAVDARYADVPRSSKVLIDTSSTDRFQPANVSFETTVNSSWERVAPDDGPDYDVLGPGTIGAAMLAPTFDADNDGIYSDQHVTDNLDESTLHPLHPYDFGVDAATGWEGGKLEVYRNAEDETAVRWRTEWDSEESAATFQERYVELLEVRGDADAGEYVDAYEFSGENGFTGRVSARQNGTSVVVVHGPSVEALRALDDGAASTPRPDSGSSGDEFPTSHPATQELLSGPGALGVVVALLGLSAWVVVRRR